MLPLNNAQSLNLLEVAHNLTKWKINISTVAHHTSLSQYHTAMERSKMLPLHTQQPENTLLHLPEVYARSS